MSLGTSPQMGFSVHLEGSSYATVNRQMLLMATAGAKIIRVEFQLARMEIVQGIIDYTTYDQIIALAQQYGIKVLALMDQYNGANWSNGGHGDWVNWPILPTYYQAWCNAVAAHYGNSITYYELGNEPNLNIFWLPSANVAAYTQLMIAGYNGIKSANAGAIVITGGVTSLGNINSDTFITGIYANGGKGYFDGFGIHPYSRPSAPDFSKLTACLAIMTTNGEGSKPIYITELGWPTGTSSSSVSEATQAAYIEQIYTMIMTGSFQYVPFLCWYDFKDDGTDISNSENNYGITHNDNYIYPFFPKPSFYSYQKMAKVTRPLPSYLNTFSPNIYTFYDNFNRANGAIGNLPTGQSWIAPNWNVSGNVAKSNPTLGSDMIVNGNFEVDTSGWTAVNSLLQSVPGGQIGNCLQISNIGDNNGYAYQEITTVIGQWYWVNIGFKNGNSIALCQVGTSPGDNTYGQSGFSIGNWSGIAFLFRATTTTTYISLKVNTPLDSQYLYYDNVQMKPVTLSTIMALVSTTFPNIDMGINNTKVQVSENGLVLNVDSSSNPQNFVLVTLNENKGKIYLTKCVAGIYTVVLSVNISYIPGGIIRVVKIGNSYQVYYNGNTVGTPQTISDVGIVNNTLHGMWLPDSQASLDNFTLNSS